MIENREVVDQAKTAGQMKHVGMLIAVLAAGCSALPGQRSASWRHSSNRHSAPPVVADPDYRVGVGDQVSLRKSSAIPPEIAEVEGDGSIRLKDGKSLRVDGSTTREIASLLDAEYGGNPAVEVAVRKYNSQFVHVYGTNEEDGSQSVPFRGKESLSALIGRIGCKQCRRGVTAKLVRPATSVGAAPDIYTIHLDAYLRPEEPARDVLVQPNDYVYLEKGRTGAAASEDPRFGSHSRRAFDFSRAGSPLRLARLNHD